MPSLNAPNLQSVNKPNQSIVVQSHDTNVQEINICVGDKIPEHDYSLSSSNNTDEDHGEEIRNNWLVELGDEDDQEKPASMQYLESERMKNELVRNSLKMWANEFNI